MAIVGSDIVDNMLGTGDPLGKEIRVDGEPYTVIGVGEAQGKMFGHEHGQLGGDSADGLSAALRFAHASLNIYVDAGGGGAVMDVVSDELRTIMRAAASPGAGRAGLLSRSTPARPSRTCWARF